MRAIPITPPGIAWGRKVRPSRALCDGYRKGLQTARYASQKSINPLMPPQLVDSATSPAGDPLVLGCHANCRMSSDRPKRKVARLSPPGRGEVGEAGEDQKDRARKVPKSSAGEIARCGEVAKEKITGRFFSAVSKHMGENRDLELSPYKQ